MTARDALERLRGLADAEVAAGMGRFFKTGLGQYGEGDQFLGVKSGPLRRLVRELGPLPLAEVGELLDRPEHEARALGLLVLVRLFDRGAPPLRECVYRFYLGRTGRVNNWDLVDISAPGIVGGFLLDRDRSPLDQLAGSPSLWERRISIVATQTFIRAGQFEDTLRLAERLLGDREDLLHKAAGWMLREVGKRDPRPLEEFLLSHHRSMPRTMLRYAIEHFPPQRRREYLAGKVAPGRAGG